MRILPPALAVVCAAFAVTALAAPAHADDPSVTERGGKVTYRDPEVQPDATDRLTGTLVTVVVDGQDGAPSRTEYLLRSADDELVSLVLAEDLPDTVTGGEATVTVDRAGPAAPARVGTLTVEPVAAAAPAPGTQRVYLAIANAVTSSNATLQAAVSGALDDWIADANGYITSFQIASTQRLAATCTSDASVAWEQAAALFPDIDFFGATGNHLVLIGKGSCASFGLGTVGSDGLGSSGAVWLREEANGTLDALGPALHHELGHNYGLLHANRVSCSATTCTGTAEEYGNYYSTMGVTFTGFGTSALDTVIKDELGVLAQCEAVSVSVPAGKQKVNGTWYLDSRDKGEGIRGLRVVDPGSGKAIWLDWRAGAGRDAETFYASSYSDGTIDWPNGITIQRAEADASTTLLAIGSGGALKPAIVPGQKRTVGGVEIWADTPVDGRIPVRLVVSRSGGSGSTSKVFGRVKVSGGVVGAAVKATPSGYPAGTCFDYQWSVDGTVVPGATGSTYTPTPAQEGRDLTVRVRAFANGLAPSSKSATTVIRASRMVLRDKPTITGTPTVGQVLTVDPGSWRPAAVQLSIEWQRFIGGAWQPIAGQTASTYTVAAADAGKRVRVQVTGTLPGYTPGVASSAWVVGVS